MIDDLQQQVNSRGGVLRNLPKWFPVHLLSIIGRDDRSNPLYIMQMDVVVVVAVLSTKLMRHGAVLLPFKCCGLTLAVGFLGFAQGFLVGAFIFAHRGFLKQFIYHLIFQHHGFH